MINAIEVEMQILERRHEFYQNGLQELIAMLDRPEITSERKESLQKKFTVTCTRMEEVTVTLGTLRALMKIAQKEAFFETQPEHVPDLVNNPYIIVITIRDEDAVHAIDSNAYLRDKNDDRLLTRFAQTLARLRYEDINGVTEAIDNAYASIGKAVAQEIEQEMRKEHTNE